jgi:hypothetical protein
VIIQCLTVLSTELISFKVTQLDKSALLTWQTASEINVKNFDIEKSIDGTIFSKIKEVKANNTPSVYQAFDDNFTEFAYYRLETRDLDGKTEDSKIVFVDKNVKSSGLKIYPNPAKESLKIEGIDAQDEWQVLDVLGRVRAQFKGQQVLDLKTYPEGIYFIKVADGKVSQFVVSK